ncbi:hypothetical protein V5799_034431 [Amblyomma americanum]|uniref:Subolesin n=1 Tax=Amblyomma americanum TaxID=6943 RepID=A0AAQ4DKH1_AMBAM
MACATLKRASDWDAAADASAKPPCKRRRCCASPSPPPTRPHQQRPSPFIDAAPEMTSEEIAANVYDEMCRLQRRKRLCVQGPDGAPSSSVGSQTVAPGPEQPVFTMRQIGAICQTMMNAREAVIRQKYDQVLSAKLTEQYDTFVRFTQDQITRRFEGAAPSYLS